MALEAILTVDISCLRVITDLSDAYSHLRLVLTIFRFSFFLSDIVKYVSPPLSHGCSKGNL